MKTHAIDLDFERLRRLPPGDDVWQLAIRPTPQWILPDDDEEAEPYRPLLGFAVSLATGLVGGGKLVRPGEPTAGTALGAVLALARTNGIHTRPAVIEVDEPALRDTLVAALGDVGIHVALIGDLSSLDEPLASMRRALAGEEADLLFYDPAVSVDRLRAFAEAALAFHAAAPWNHLGDNDLVHVETRRAPEGMRWFTVLGGAGIRYGLAFFTSRMEFVEFMDDLVPPEMFTRTPHWSLSFDPPWMLPAGELIRWEDQALPRTPDGHIPVLSLMSNRGPGKPVGAPRLAFVEGLLRALAATSEDEMDAGRWSHTVDTAGEEMTITLALPDLLEAAKARPGARRPEMPPGALPDRRLLERETAKIGRLIAERKWESVEEINAFLAANAAKPLPAAPAEGPREEAMEFFYAALDSQGRRRIQLARQALQRWPDCADALVLLAEEMPNPERSTALYRAAMEAAERVLGPEAFVEHKGHFWGIHETRPYMRARHGLAHRLWDRGERDAAVAHWLGMLELNPGDNQGVRYCVLPCLLELGRDREAAAVVEAYNEDGSAMMGFLAALVSFRLHGKGLEANRRLAAAMRLNPHAVKYLLDDDNMPDMLPESYSMGSEEEAIILADESGDAWKATPGALEWLREQRRVGKKLREEKRKKRGRR